MIDNIIEFAERNPLVSISIVLAAFIVCGSYLIGSCNGDKGCETIVMLLLMK